MTTAGVEAILFDLGGTCLEIDHPRVAEALVARGITPPADWVPRAERAGRERLEGLVAAGADPDAQWYGFFQAFLAAAGAAPGDVDPVFGEPRDFHRRHHLRNRVMPGIPETLRTLSERGYRVAAISNSDGRAEALLSLLGLAHEFEFVVDSRDAGIEKPDPLIFLGACARLELPPARCAYVGDVHGIDVGGARAAGLVPVLLDVYGSYEPHADGTARVAEPAQLLGLFPDRRNDVARRAPRGAR